MRCPYVSTVICIELWPSALSRKGSAALNQQRVECVPQIVEAEPQQPGIFNCGLRAYRIFVMADWGLHLYYDISSLFGHFRKCPRTSASRPSWRNSALW